ncbi:MAG: ArnT family glycosyltransferase, partial [Phycisphaerae bacterium]
MTRTMPCVGSLVFLVALAGVIWRTVRYLQGFPFWGDEGFVLMNFILRDFSNMHAKPLEYIQIVPIGFLYITEAMSRLLGYSEYALRLVPYLAGVGGVILFWKFAKQVVNRHAAALAVGILAATYYLVRHGAEVKAYSTDFFLSMVLVYLGWAVYRHRQSWGRWLALSLVGAVSVWVSFTAMFTAAGIGVFFTLWMLRKREWKLIGPLVFFAAVAGGSTLAQVIFYAAPLSAATPGYTSMVTWKDSFP